MADPDLVNTVERPGTGAEHRQQDLYPGASAVDKGFFLASTPGKTQPTAGTD
jgi:hypothetical protein